MWFGMHEHHRKKDNRDQSGGYSYKVGQRTLRREWRQ
jgi:hypothetical protein